MFTPYHRAWAEHGWRAPVDAPRDVEWLRLDGSVDLHFGPTPPAGGDSNWVQTVPGQHWFCYMRFYGPLAPYFDRSWKLGDITAADHG